MANNRKTRSPEKSRSNHNSNQIRIIGGKWRGRKLNFPSIPGLRPTGDRIRETLFNWLTGYVEGANIVDLFAGSGALGLEALSRGAKKVSFIELDSKAAKAINANLALLDAELANPNNNLVRNESALDYLKSPEPETCDLLLLDPPFYAELHDQILKLVEKSHIMKNTGLIYIESPKDKTVELPSGWSIYREKINGQVKYLLCQRKRQKPES